jgi:hypothetical protein
MLGSAPRGPHTGQAQVGGPATTVDRRGIWHGTAHKHIGVGGPRCRLTCVAARPSLPLGVWGDPLVVVGP